MLCGEPREPAAANLVAANLSDFDCYTINTMKDPLKCAARFARIVNTSKLDVLPILAADLIVRALARGLNFGSEIRFVRQSMSGIAGGGD
jgi:hypothetical protein